MSASIIEPRSECSILKYVSNQPRELVYESSSAIYFPLLWVMHAASRVTLSEWE